MRTVPAGIQAKLDADATLTLTRIVTMTQLDGTVSHFTIFPDDVIVGATTYTAAPAIEISAIQSKNDGSSQNVQLKIGATVGGIIDYESLIEGRYTGATVEIFAVDWSDTSLGVIALFKGTVGVVTRNERQSATIELNGPAARALSLALETYSAGCRADLGDRRCKIPILPDDVARSTAYAVGDFVRAKSGGSGYANYNNLYYECTTAGTTSGTAPTYTTTISATTTDGSAVFTARNAWLRYATVASITGDFVIAITVTESRKASTPGGFSWFKYGGLIWRSGNNNGQPIEIRDWDASTNSATIMMPTIGVMQVGDELELFAGCSKAKSSCIEKFNNILNMRAEPDVPGGIS